MSHTGTTPQFAQLEVRSEVHSSSSRHSSGSTASQAAAQARAIAEAALTRARYAQRRIDVEVEKARIEATLDALKQEGEAEAALAAAEVLEAAAEEALHPTNLVSPGIPGTTPPSIRRAQEFVDTHFQKEQDSVAEELDDTEHQVSSNQPRTKTPNPHTREPLPTVNPREHSADPAPHRANRRSANNVYTNEPYRQPASLLSQQTEMSDLAAFLARRDILTTAFKVFDNRPESYLSWKSMFHNAMAGLDLKASEELDLLTKWLDGPDLNNSLVGVLMRFRSDPYAVMADVEQMFHNFMVREDHRDYLRFLWFKNHDLDGEVEEFRMCVHVFGNCPSPSVAIYGLRRTALEGESEYGREVRQFIERHFYVDDGLSSFSSTDEAIDVLSRTQKMLAQSNIRLHKISSNSPDITKAFPNEDLATGLQGLDLGQTSPPMQRSLGLGWDLSTDLFKFQVTISERPYTKRGVLSVVNSVFDPIGFAVSVIIEGRAILREISSDASDWDTDLPKEKQEKWQKWKNSLKYLQQLEIPRMYTSIPLSEAHKKEIIVFCDASTKAVGAVAYLKLTTGNCHSEVGFLLGKARLAPKPDISIPRLELCAAMLAVEVAEVVVEELDITVDKVSFFTDSKVVLGYIFNEKRRFYVYVHNRVERIRRFTHAHQWHYVPTHLNPADHATRALPAEKLSSSTWLSGPAFLINFNQSHQHEPFDLVSPETDTEIRPVTTTCVTALSKATLGSARFERFSSWSLLLRAIARLQLIVKSFQHSTDHTCRGRHENHLDEEHLRQAKVTIVRTVQRELYAEEMKCINKGEPIKQSSPLSKLCPFIDTDGILRVGGRLKRAHLTSDETHPMLIPAKHHLALLIIRHFHETVYQQGRHFTEGSVRAAGFWIVGGKREVSSVIFNCVTCRKLRGKQQGQIMTNLPADRLSTDPPFSHVGLDVFGPWSVAVRKTRGVQTDAKRWAVIFTCMSTRAIHIELIESMDTSSFINALRRLFAIRGAAKLLRSDCGTNFVSACRELQIDKRDCNNPKINSFLKDNHCIWEFNPPHASHMAGSWERMIGVTRRILDAMLLECKNATLTHEVLVTFMAEVTAIVNARPLTTVSTDPQNPVILTPAMLLTQKVGIPPIPPSQFEARDLFRAQWRRVQYLADVFWSRWQKEYIAGLQERRKWRIVKPNLQPGDVILLKECFEHRNEWPLGLVTNTFPSEDGLVRKIEVKTFRKGEHRFYLRPVSQVVLLVSKDNA
ncbi:uncharacterized protein LOC144019709 [Festucalex cinctus]